MARLTRSSFEASRRHDWNMETWPEQTDRQTDRQTDGGEIAYHPRSLLFFKKLAQLRFEWGGYYIIWFENFRHGNLVKVSLWKKEGWITSSFLIEPPYVRMYRGCPSWNAHGKGRPTGSGGGDHQKWVQCPNPASTIGPASSTLARACAKTLSVANFNLGS